MTSKSLTLVVGTRTGDDAPIDNQTDTSGLLTCPLCHTPASLSQRASEAGAAWRCIRCRQLWDAARLSAVAAYAAWNVERKAGQPSARRAWSVTPPD